MKVGFPALLGLLFIGLKLTGYITWSWVWVLSPFWVPLAALAGFAAVMLLFTLVVVIIAAICDRKAFSR